MATTPKKEDARRREAAVLVKWSQQGPVIALRILGGKATFANDETSDHTVMTVRQSSTDREEIFTLFGTLSIDDMIDKFVDDEHTVMAYITNAITNPWPRLLATPGKHPRVSVDWSTWAPQDASDENDDDDDYKDGCNDENDAVNHYGMGTDI